MKQFNLFIPMTKVDVEKRTVYGIATAEQADKVGEVMDYESTVPYYKAWSSEIEKASGGKSLGNLREMHTNIAAGKITQINFDDTNKTIEISAKVVDDSSWNKVLEGVLTGFSQGGRYIKTWKDPDDKSITRYTADPSEVSLVDNPCLASATFEVIKADGTIEMRKFKTQEKPMDTVIDGKPVQPKYKPIQKWEASDGKTFDKKDEWRAYELTLETSVVTAPALNALAELEKAVSEKEAEKEESKEEVEKTDAEKAEDEKQEAEKVKEKKSKKSEAIATLKKSLSEAYDSKCAIDALCTIEYLIMGEMQEEEDEPGQVADLKEAIDRLKSFIASEIMENAGDPAEKAASTGDLAKAGARHSASDKANLGKAAASVDEASDHLEDAKKHHGKVGDAHGAMRSTHDDMTKTMGAMQDCMKCAKADTKEDMPAAMKEHMDKMAGSLDSMDNHMDKADKSHGKVGKAHDGIEAAHDAAHHALKAVGAMDGKGENDEAEKAVKVEMKKAADELTLVKADLTTTQTENAELKKALDTINGQVPSLIERIKKLESQPMPAKGAVFPVQKGHEAKPAETPVEAPSYSTYGASPEQMREILNIR